MLPTLTSKVCWLIAGSIDAKSLEEKRGTQLDWMGLVSKSLAHPFFSEGFMPSTPMRLALGQVLQPVLHLQWVWLKIIVDCNPKG